MTTPAVAATVSRSPGCQPRAGHGPVGDPAGLVHPAERVQHVIRDRRDFRRGGDRQAAGCGRSAVLAIARPGTRGDAGERSAGR